MIEEPLENDLILITDREKEILRANQISLPKFRHELKWSGKSKTNIFY